MDQEHSNGTGVTARNQVKLMEFFGEIMEFVLQHGQGGLDAMEDLDPEHAQMLDELVDMGLLEKSSGRYSLTIRAVQAAENRALAQAAARLAGPAGDGVCLDEAGPAPGAAFGRAGHWGEPLNEADLTAALKQAISRNGASCPLGPDEGGLDDYLGQCRSPASAVLLLDMSGSMARFGRFIEAKKVAMAMRALVRQRFPNDTVETIGFYSLAEPISETRLPLMMPKPVSGDSRRLVQRVPLSQARRGPQYFTNLQMGLQLAGQTLAGRQGNPLVFIITDGHPTAHVDGDHLMLIYPPDERTALATLAEAKKLAQAGVRLATFALIGDSEDFDWVGFVEQLTRATRGVSFYCGSEDLAGCVMETYLCGKMRKSVAV